MEHVGTLAETNDVLSPTIIPLFGILSPPAEQEECHFCFETITKGQFMVLKLPFCGHLTHTGCFKTWASIFQKNPSYTAPIAELPTHTKTPVPFAYRNIPKNSTAECAATQKSTRNALKISQSYSHS